MKKRLKKGSGEILGFVVCVPLLLWMILYIISIAQIALAREQLTYVAYAAGRAAVISETRDSAQANATAVASSSKNVSNYEGLTVTIEGGETGWYKGVYVTVTAKCKVNTVIDFFGGEKECSIVMMVERPASPSGTTN